MSYIGGCESPTNQFVNPEALLFPTIASMPCVIIQWKLVCLGLNVGLIKDPPSM
jgi:hypothetical protein